MMDPNVKREYKGTDGTVGFVTTWDSEKNDVGKGEQEIKNITEEQRIDLEVKFERPMKNTASVFMTTDAVANNQTKVKWGMAGRSPYPINLMNLFIPSVLGKDLQTSLENLKVLLEK